MQNSIIYHCFKKVYCFFCNITILLLHKKTRQAICLSGYWLRRQDLNLRPSGYEPDELPDCSTPRYVALFFEGLIIIPHDLFIVKWFFCLHSFSRCPKLFLYPCLARFTGIWAFAWLPHHSPPIALPYAPWSCLTAEVSNHRQLAPGSIGLPHFLLQAVYSVSNMSCFCCF